MGRGRSGERKQIVPPKRGLILCEGLTEKKYFDGLLTQERYRRDFSSISVDVVQPPNHSPVGLVNQAKEKMKQAKRDRNSYDFVWVVFDKDGHADVPKAFELARTSNPPISIAFTIPCFEFFVLLHFERTTKPFEKCDKVISQLKASGHITDYEKATNVFDLLLPQMRTGIKNSEWVERQFQPELDGGAKRYDLSAYSDVHALVRYLYSLLPNSADLNL